MLSNRAVTNTFSPVVHVIPSILNVPIQLWSSFSTSQKPPCSFAVEDVLNTNVSLHVHGTEIKNENFLLNILVSFLACELSLKPRVDWVNLL